MPAPQNFLDSLENLRLVASVSLEHCQNNRDEFAKSASGVQIRQANKSISQIRLMTMQLEKEFTILDYLIERGGIFGAAD